LELISAEWSGLRLGDGLNWDNFSSENRIILIPKMKIGFMLREKEKKISLMKKREGWFDENTPTFLAFG
jgi:hypothetical protein